jgi:hypothetical protein
LCHAQCASIDPVRVADVAHVAAVRACRGRFLRSGAAGAVPTASAEEFARAIALEVAAAGMAERVTVQSFDWRTLRALKRIAPEIPTACLTVEAEPMDTVRADASGASPWHDGLKRADHGGSLPRTVRAAGREAWSPFWRNLTPGLAAEARGLGLAVVPWTVNEPGDIERMLDLGVDGHDGKYVRSSPVAWSPPWARASPPPPSLRSSNRAASKSPSSSSIRTSTSIRARCRRSSTARCS